MANTSLSWASTRILFYFENADPPFSRTRPSTEEYTQRRLCLFRCIRLQKAVIGKSLEAVVAYFKIIHRHYPKELKYRFPCDACRPVGLTVRTCSQYHICSYNALCSVQLGVLLNIPPKMPYLIEISLFLLRCDNNNIGLITRFEFIK